MKTLLITAALAVASALFALPARAAEAAASAVAAVRDLAIGYAHYCGAVLCASVPTGTTFHIASAFGSPLATSAASNAAECVLSMASTAGLANGDFVEVTSGWGRLNKRVFRVKSLSANTSITLEGCDTTNTTFFPAGQGTGSVRKATTFTQITQVTAVSSSGGDPVQVEYKYVESDVRYSINDGFNATSYQLTLDADAIGTAGYNALRSLTDVQTDTILRINKRSGAISLVPCTVALNEADSMNDGQITTVNAAFNGNGRLTKYGP